MAPTVIRSRPATEPTLYLTFDDGPDERGTPSVLDILAAHDARATFFVVGRRAQAHPELLMRATRAGHTIGNHSFDHRYSNYFRGADRLTQWISDCEARILDITGEQSAGFRPPAGIRTPPLSRAVNSLGIPMILWNTRFYDSVFAWREGVALTSLAKAKNGDIVLLHDHQTKSNLPVFLKTLDSYIKRARHLGFRFESLRRSFRFQDSGPTTQASVSVLAPKAES